MSGQGSDRAARRARRKAALGRTIDTSVPSPCISVCQIDSAIDECLGCRRTTDEIRDWIIMTAKEKKAVLARIAQGSAGANHDL